jgi:hypothetical protein
MIVCGAPRAYTRSHLISNLKFEIGFAGMLDSQALYAN